MKYHYIIEFSVINKQIIARIIIFIIIIWQTHSIAQPDSIFYTNNDWELFPIINYDTDAGLGYGAKGFFYNFFNNNESADLTAYNSTKGERWYRFVFSVPDMQRRQGKSYKSSFDLIIDYDKWINYLYYFDSKKSEFPNAKDNKTHEKYVREPIEISTIFSRAFTINFISELGLKYKSINCYKFQPEGILQFQKPANVQHISILINFRFDTRTNFLKPNKGIVLEFNNEIAKDIQGKKQNYFKTGFTFRSYLQLGNSDIVIASRIILEAITNVSYQNLLSLGGNKSIRGLPQDRYLSNSFILFNGELRFPLWRKFSGIFGGDFGNSESAPNWIINPVLGLRFNMDNFIVRADLGFGKESSGFYFNFGHLF